MGVGRVDRTQAEMAQGLFSLVHIISFSGLLSLYEYRLVIVDSGVCRCLVEPGPGIDSASQGGQKTESGALAAGRYLRHRSCARLDGPGDAARRPGSGRPHPGIMPFCTDLVRRYGGLLHGAKMG